MISPRAADGHPVLRTTGPPSFQGIPPTGRRVPFDVMDIVGLDDGRIVEHWGVVYQLGLLRQLGVLA
jgi:predicted ester cyclase